MAACPECKLVHSSNRPCAARSQSRSDRIGQCIDGFVIQEKIHSTRGSSVYRAKSESPQGKDEVAIKISLGGTQQRVDREFCAQETVKHPYIARTLAAGTLSDGDHYLITAWIPGRTLHALLESGPVSWQESLDLIRHLCAGLHAIHQQGIVHRDLKPSNIMIPSDEQVPVKILDFGHSLILDASRITDEGVAVGSVEYMAPEQARQADIDGRADLYSLGVLLYRALTGSLPFFNESAAEVIRLHQSEAVQPPSERAPDREIPAQVEDLCLWLLAKDPEARVPNCRVLSVTLRVIDRYPSPSNSSSAQAFA